MTFTIPVVVGIILGVNQVLKLAGIPTKFIPAISMVLGVAAGIFFMPGTNLQETLFNGIAVGLGSNGLFDVAKSTVTQPTYYKVLADDFTTEDAADQAAPEAPTNKIGF